MFVDAIPISVKRTDPECEGLKCPDGCDGPVLLWCDGWEGDGHDDLVECGWCRSVWRRDELSRK